MEDKTYVMKDQIAELRNKLIEELMDAVDRARVEIGNGLSVSDVLGAIEWVKLKYYDEVTSRN